MQLVIKKWGNSAGLPLNKVLLEQIHASVGATVEVVIQNGGLLIKPIDGTPTLESLLEGTSQEDYVLTKEEGWMQSGPAGKEVL